MGKRTAGAAGDLDLTDAFKRIDGFEVYVVFSIEPLESIPNGWPIQTRYHLSEGRFPWLHVCYVDADRRAYKLWEYACKPSKLISTVAPQSAASWLVEIVKRIERCEIQNCRQSAIDSDDVYKLLTNQRLAFSKMVGYSIPNLTEAAIELVEIVGEQSTDWLKLLNKAERSLTWGNRYQNLTITMVELLEVILNKYPEPATLEELGHDPESRSAFLKAFKCRRNGVYDYHSVKEVIQNVGRGKYTLIDPKRVTRYSKSELTSKKPAKSTGKKSPAKSPDHAR